MTMKEFAALPPWQQRYVVMEFDLLQKLGRAPLPAESAKEMDRLVLAGEW